MGARRYSASTGRFLQRDQYDGALDNLGLASDPLTGSRYALAAGNPVSFIETDGHKFEDTGGGGAAAAISCDALPTQSFCGPLARGGRGNPDPAGLASGGGGGGSAASFILGSLKNAAAWCGKRQLCADAVSTAAGAVAAPIGLLCLPAAGACTIVIAASVRGGVSYGLAKAGGRSTKTALLNAGQATLFGGGRQAMKNRFPGTKPLELAKRGIRAANGERVVKAGWNGAVILSKDGQIVRKYTPPRQIPVYARKRR
jgi:hypothetical protein